jgi:rare lipoprotein A
MKFFVSLLLVLLAACSSTPPRSGGYYKDDGPDANPPGNLASVPDAVPRSEPLHKFANNPYTVFGKRYVPLASVQPFSERGTASWYGKRFHGQKTSSGEAYDMYKMTAAHPTLPIPSYVRVTHVGNGKSVIVRINDRGPFHGGRIIDLSYVAAYKLGYVGAGSAQVQIEAVVPGQPARRAAL